MKKNKIDILLTTYETCAAELEKKPDKQGNTLPDLFNVAYYRVILDEAQTVRNPKSKAFKAVTKLESKHRLALTGTPFVNKPEDVHSLLSFCGVQPLADPAFFKLHISFPIQDRKRAGLTRLRTALAYTALRRTKDVANIELVKKTVQICHVDFPDGEHKKIHDAMFLSAQSAFEGSINGAGKEYTENGEGVDAVSHQAMFEMLLRVRQACCHGNLVPKDRYERAAAIMNQLTNEDGSRKKLTAAEGNRLIDQLQIGDNDDTKPTAINTGKDIGHSPKMIAILNTIEEMANDEKGIIFSEWTSFLDIVEIGLKEAGHEFTRLDGSMSMESRIDAMESFSNCDNIRFILCSLKAAGTGINLTRANVVFMTSPWWNDAVEAQVG